MERIIKFFTTSVTPQQPKKIREDNEDLEPLLKNARRYITHISTDKPIYKPEDTIYIRTVILDAITQKPLLESHNLRFETTVSLLAPSGEKVFEQNVRGSITTLHGSYKLGANAAGGVYCLKISYETHGMASSERSLEVRSFQNPRLNKELKFKRKGYGSGDEAVATLNVKRAEGGIPAGAFVSATARIDGKEFKAGGYKLDKKGNCTIKFIIPGKISVGKGTLNCVINDQGVKETASKTIPIILKRMDVYVYPEGGDLVVGLNSGIYIEAYTAYGEPSDLKGVIVSLGKTKEIQKENVNVKTDHEGRGKFFFTPKSQKQYYLKVLEPAGVTELIRLPIAKTKGVSLRSQQNTYDYNENMKFKISSTTSEDLVIKIYKREICLKTTNIQISKPNADELISIKLGQTDTSFEGILRVTVFDQKNSQPLAERLVFKKPKKQLNLDIKADYKSYCPGDSVSLTVTATDESQQPIECFVCLTVTDESVLESLEDRKKPPRLPVMVFLEQEVDHLEDAKVYLDSSNPKSDIYVDLLLGCQGWRRFCFIDPTKFLEKHIEKSERILAVHKGTIFEDSDISDEEDGCLDDLEFNGMVCDEIVLEDMDDRSECLDVKLNIKEFKEDKKQPKKKKKELQKKRKLEMKQPKKLEEEKAPKRKRLPKEQIVEEKIKEEKIKEECWVMDKDEDEDEDEDDFEPDFDMGLKEPSSVITWIRKYAFVVKANRKAGEREIFTDTLYWSSNIQTDKNGKATVKFDLCDSITSFHILADGYSASGIFGSGDKLIESKDPFYIEPKLPLEVSVGDELSIPIVLVNSLEESLKVKLATTLSSNDLSNVCTTTTKEIFEGKKKIIVKGKSRKRVMLDLTVKSSKNTSCLLTLKGAASAFSDSVARSIKIKPLGFPMSKNYSEKINGGEKKTFSFTVDKFVKNSMEASCSFFLSSQSNITKALEGLLREPYGCFEQTSSTTYPTIMAQQYFKARGDDELVKRTEGLIGKGYKRLLSFECKKGGYEWFGEGNGHEALTAYGVLEFLDMSKVFPVDDKMLKRTINWLLSRRDLKGGFLRNQRALDDFGGAPQSITNAYIIWSLTESGIIKEVEMEILEQEKLALTSKDTYFVGLAAGALYNNNMPKRAFKLAKKLVKAQQEDGSVLNSKTTITRGYGRSLLVETTCIAILAWLKEKNGKFVANIKSGMDWLLKNCQGGRFGSTQSTIMALKAIIACEKERKSERDGMINITVDDEHKFRLIVSSKTKINKPLEVPSDEFNKILSKQGKHKVEIETSEGLSLPVLLNIRYYSTMPKTSKKSQIDLKIKLSSEKFKEGKGGEISASIINKSAEKQGMTMAMIGIPGGMVLRHEQLQELVKGKKIAYYEIFGRKLFIYLRGMKEKQVVDLNIDVIARIPGKYTAPSSCAYLYYTDEFKTWVHPLKCHIE